MPNAQRPTLPPQRCRHAQCAHIPTPAQTNATSFPGSFVVATFTSTSWLPTTSLDACTTAVHPAADTRRHETTRNRTGRSRRATITTRSADIGDRHCINRIEVCSGQGLMCIQHSISSMRLKLTTIRTSFRIVYSYACACNCNVVDRPHWASMQAEMKFCLGIVVINKHWRFKGIKHDRFGHSRNSHMKSFTLCNSVALKQSLHTTSQNLCCSCFSRTGSHMAAAAQRDRRQAWKHLKELRNNLIRHLLRSLQIKGHQATLLLDCTVWPCRVIRCDI